MYKVIKDKVAIKNDYNGKTIGYLNMDEIVYPIKILDNWIMFIYNNNYVWSKMNDDNNSYILNIDELEIKNIDKHNIHGTKSIDKYITVKL